MFNLTDREIEESHVVSHLDNRLGSDATHGSTETTVKLENGELVEDGRVDFGLDGVGEELFGVGRVDLLPVPVMGQLGCGWDKRDSLHLFALGALGEVAVKEEEEGLHLGVDLLSVSAGHLDGCSADREMTSRPPSI